MKNERKILKEVTEENDDKERKEICERKKNFGEK